MDILLVVKLYKVEGSIATVAIKKKDIVFVYKGFIAKNLFKLLKAYFI